MEGAQVNVRCDFIQGRLMICIGNNKRNCFGYAVIVRHLEFPWVAIQVRLMEIPPSTRSAEPVVKLDASDAR